MSHVTIRGQIDVQMVFRNEKEIDEAVDYLLRMKAKGGYPVIWSTRRHIKEQ